MGEKGNSLIGNDARLPGAPKVGEPVWAKDGAPPAGAPKDGDHAFGPPKDDGAAPAAPAAAGHPVPPPAAPGHSFPPVVGGAVRTEHRPDDSPSPR
ncbi:hypothetical protein ACI797_17380 [Geodermatophilus sp. SYSU D00691]